jgi:hypothetical protein
MKIEKREWQGVEAVSIVTADVELIGVYSFGPRLASLSYQGGENILLWEPDKYLRTVEGRPGWNLRGGHRCWHAGNGADECEMTYNSDDMPAECELLDNGFVLTGALDPLTNTRRGIKVTVSGENQFEVDNFTINCGDLLFGAAHWALTCTVPNETTQYVIPLGDGTSFDTATIVLFKEWAGHGARSFADTQFAICDDAMVITPQGEENKRMVQSPAGIIAMNDPQRGIVFAKRSEFSPLVSYPLNTNIAAYVGPDNFMVEMETMGAETCIKPGETAHHCETWLLKGTLLDEVNGSAACKLFA